jgi:hypothetical protein
MKASLAVILVLILVGCESSRQSAGYHSDAELQRSLVGTWVCHWGVGEVHSTIIVLPDGGYSTQIEGFKYNKPGIFILGRFQVKNGDLIDTIIKHSSKNVTVPLVVHGHIKRAGDKLLIVRWDGMEKDSEYKKID